MIEPDRLRTIKAVEIDQFAASHRINDTRAAAFRQIEHEFETINQDVFLEFGNDLPGGNCAA